MNKITPERLAAYEAMKEYLSYNPDTGDITWLKSTGAIKAGKVVRGVNSCGYTRVKFRGKNYPTHRVGFYFHYRYLPEFLDHINGDKADNRIQNLRPTDKSTNNYNSKTPVTNTSGVKGVSWCKKHNKWHAKLGYKNKVKFLGYFSDINEAEAAVKAFREEKHGEFARHV